jgi:PIN domain nuclease of toxin-antitoxin system
VSVVSVLLDTHAVLFLLREPAHLSRAQRAAIDAATGPASLAVAAITLWEIAMLVAHERIGPTDAIEVLESEPRFRVVPLSGRIARESVRLTALRDPADQLIVATARVEGLRLITSDRRIRKSRTVAVV